MYGAPAAYGPTGPTGAMCVFEYVCLVWKFLYFEFSMSDAFGDGSGAYWKPFGIDKWSKVGHPGSNDNFVDVYVYI